VIDEGAHGLDIGARIEVEAEDQDGTPGGGDGGGDALDGVGGGGHGCGRGEATRSMASAGAGPIGGGSSAMRGAADGRSSPRPTSLGSAMWTGPMRGARVTRSAARTLPSVSSPSSVIACFVNGRYTALRSSC